MPDWLLAVVGWINLILGSLGLWRSVELLLAGGRQARDSTGLPAPLVLAESSGLTLVGAAALLGDSWVYLVLPAGVLLTVSEVHRIRQSLRRRRRRSSQPALGKQTSDP
jgi:hypothetical protein